MVRVFSVRSPSASLRRSSASPRVANNHVWGLMYSRVHHSPMEPELVSREKALSTWRTPWHEGFCINELCGFSGGYNLKEGHKKIEDASIASSTSILFSIRISRRHTRGAPTAMLTQSLHTQGALLAASCSVHLSAELSSAGKYSRSMRLLDGGL